LRAKRAAGSPWDYLQAPALAPDQTHKRPSPPDASTPSEHTRSQIEELQVEDIRNRVQTRNVRRWLGVTRMSLFTLAIAVLLIAALVVYVISLIEGHWVDPWLEKTASVLHEIIQTGISLRGVVALAWRAVACATGCG
jgi:tetrahydromethanopterin S-methyltransferase subunit F